jgi:cytochrome P450
VYTSSAEAIHQIMSKRDAFPKPTEAYNILEMYGKNVLTTEGAEWRMHRRITAASFNERNAALVFAESIDQTQGLITQWLGADGKGDKTIKTIEHDTMSLMLHIIGYVGFGLRLLWPGQTLPADADPKLAKYSTLEPPEGYSLNFEDALAHTLEHILILLLVPKWLLSKYSTPPRHRAIN